jgi:hypothetical protein
MNRSPFEPIDFGSFGADYDWRFGGMPYIQKWALSPTGI